MRTLIVTAVLSLTVAHVVFASAVPSKPVAPVPPQGQAHATKQSTLPKEWAEIVTRLAVIDSTVARLARPAKTSLWSTLMPAIIGLVGGLIGGILSLFGQHLGVKARAKVEFAGAAVQWQLKQLAELYGPLHALLRQSHGLYRGMNKALEDRERERFKILERASGEPVSLDNKVFKIKVGNEWVLFRTITHLHDVYGKGYGVEPYFDEIVSIGGQIVKVIHDKAGYARPEEMELSEVFGRYLAHYSVLTRLHAALKDPSKKIPVDQWAVFPNEIQDLVDRGFKAISDDLMKWRASAS